VIVLGLDQGTSSTRCVALDRELREVGAASVPVACSFPAPGLVEQDPEQLAESARAAIAGALGGRDDVAALGIANQTETFVVWDRESGRAVHPAIVWQDRRTDAECAALRDHAAFVRERTGLELDATFPATKLRRVLDRTEGELAYGDVGSWLLHRLGGVHVTDAGNAARSLLCPLGGTDWDDELLALFGVPRSILPPIVDTDAVSATFDARAVDERSAVARNGSGAGRADGHLAAVPVRAVAGDQQASLFGLRCWSAGEAKVTLGTGAFALANAGHEPPAPPDGVLASTAWRVGGRTTFALEGFVPTAGAALDWFARVGALPAGPELDALLREASPESAVVCVPALQGLGTPTWEAGTRGALFGIDLGTTRADLARAVVDGVLHQVTDALDVLRPEVVRVDGGLARSPWIVQRLADLSGLRVERTSRPDTTAIGAAMLAGLAAGVWESAAAIPVIGADLIAEPALSDDARVSLRGRWVGARERAAGSANGGR
jgi:glycerol kinase